MTEKTLNNRKNGMVVLLLLVLVYVASVVLFIFGISYDILPLTLISCVWFVFGWIFFLGLKGLKPQEALVLTLFGKYVGTLKNSGFYFVNPFCTAVNPAAGTKLNQSGDVKVLGAKQSSGRCLYRYTNKENIPQDNDPEQQPPEDKRLSRQPC